jgi:S1-C subfamily serine protease
VPELTVTGGLIGRLIRGEAVPKGGAAYDYYSEFGDAIQLTVNASGKGSSGGPVIDDRGRAIGIFSFMNKGDVLISFAVPIQHGLDIMGIKPVLD